MTLPSRLGRTTRIVAAGAALMFALAACASDGGGTAGGGGTTAGGAGGSASPTGERGGYGDSGDDNGGSGEADDGDDGGNGGAKADVMVTVANYVFAPATIKVGRGDTIELSNTNPQTPHTFTVDGTKIDVSLDAGSSATATIAVPSGTYDFHCRFHASQGMRGTLVVQ
jgi:plastocyanin